MRIPNIKKFAVITLSLLVAVVAAYAGVGWYWCGPGGSGMLASLRLPDGSEYVVAQQFHHVAEPYSVGFYARSSSSEPWSWRSIDHEAWRWRSVTLSHDAVTNRVLVTERGTRRAVLDRSRNTFWFDNGHKKAASAEPASTLIGNSAPHFVLN
jgi:hypothetical protein